MTEIPPDILSKAESIIATISSRISDAPHLGVFRDLIAEALMEERREQWRRGNEELRRACVDEIASKTAELKAALAETLEIAKRNEIGPYVQRAKRALST